MLHLGKFIWIDRFLSLLSQVLLLQIRATLKNFVIALIFVDNILRGSCTCWKLSIFIATK